jgi:hypothetical protein
MLKEEVLKEVFPYADKTELIECELVFQNENFAILSFPSSLPLQDRTYVIYVFNVEDWFAESSYEKAVAIGEKLTHSLLCPNDIYNAPYEETYHLGVLTNRWYLHLPELPEGSLDSVEQTRVMCRTHINGERCFIVGSVWFDGKPVMIYRHAWQGGRDVCDRFITEGELFDEMIRYLRSLLPVKGEKKVYDPNEPSVELSRFYGRFIEVPKGNA